MEVKSYVKHIGHFLEKRRDLGRVPEKSLLVTAAVVGLYPRIPLSHGMQALHKKNENRQDKTLIRRFGVKD